MRSGLASMVALAGCLLFAAWAAAQATAPVALVEDWAQAHVIFTNGGSPQAVALAQRDPRNLQQWLKRSTYLFRSRGEDFERGEGWYQPSLSRPRRARFHTDWAIPLGATAGMQISVTPAKFTFNATAPLSFPASCTNDFVVFVINATPAAGSQANIVALNNLYTGTTSSSCPNGPQTPPTTNLTAPTFMFSYAVGSGGALLSPVLSLDGKKVAFVDSGTGNPIFHVLTWVAGQGTNATTGSVAPGSGGSSVTSLNFTNTSVTGCTASAANDSESSPYIDYANDVAYIGDNNGRLYRITGVFKATPTLAYCTTVSAGKLLTSPVYDSVSGKVFVSDGQKVYGFIPGASSFTAAGSVAVGTGTFSIVVSPIVDSTNGYVYVFSGSNLANTNSIVSQMPVSLATHVDAAIGPVTANYILPGAFDNKYYASGPSAGSLYACGTQTTSGSNPGLYTLTFAASGQMNTTPAMSNDQNINSGTNPAGYCSPLTEYYDGTTDRLFVGVGTGNSTSGANQLTSWNITSRITSATTLPTATALNELGGTSGISIDNNSSAAQASSIYFGTLATSTITTPCGANRYCAVKLTQSLLQ